eukprot:jgi/Botrbrau1/8836/Bobra.0335s0023.1
MTSAPAAPANSTVCQLIHFPLYGQYKVLCLARYLWDRNPHLMPRRPGTDGTGQTVLG